MHGLPRIQDLSAEEIARLLEQQGQQVPATLLADLVLDNFVGPNGGIMNGHWSAYDGEWWASAAYNGPLFFRLYEETGDERYLEAGLNTVHWFVNLEKLRSSSPDAH